MADCSQDGFAAIRFVMGVFMMAVLSKMQETDLSFFMVILPLQETDLSCFMMAVFFL